MTERKPRQISLFALTIGLAALTGGLWLLLNALGVGVPPFKELWPVLFLVAGAGATADYFFISRRAGSLGWAVTWIGFGVLGFSLALGYTNLRKILDWLPSFPTIIGLSLMTCWFADRQRHANSFLSGAILLTLGLVGFAARFEVLQRILPSAQVIWALLLVGGGGFLIWRTLAQKKS